MQMEFSSQLEYGLRTAKGQPLRLHVYDPERGDTSKIYNNRPWYAQRRCLTTYFVPLKMVTAEHLSGCRFTTS